MNLLGVALESNVKAMIRCKTFMGRFDMFAGPSRAWVGGAYGGGGGGTVVSFVSRDSLTAIEIYHLVSRLVSSIVDVHFRAMAACSSPLPRP